jgi:membrane-associated phospholipid phosphatase
MLFSNNALALDMIRVQTAKQIYLPWVFRDLLGPLKFQWIYGARLEEERTDFPRSKITAMRVDMAPFPWLEVSLGREITFDGHGRKEVQFWEYPRVLVQSNRSGTERSKYAGDNRFQADVSLRLADVGKYFPITRDAELYLDFGWDDTCCGTFYTPLKPGAIVGLYLPNLFLSPDTTFRVEYSNSSSFQFTHGTWSDGYVRKNHVISDFEGTAGEDLFFRLTQRLDPKLEVGMELDFARRGRTEKGLEFSTKELHRYFGVDASYKYSPALSLNLETRLEWVNNRDFVQGKRGINQVYTADVTYTFAPEIGAGRRMTLPPGALPPLAPPPRTPDPDQILSWDYAAKVAKDSWAVFTSPIRWSTTDWLIAGGVAAATGGAMLLDHEVRHVTQDNRSHAGDVAARNIGGFGVIAPAVGVVTSYVVGEAFGNEKAKQSAADGVEATVLTNVLFLYPMKFLLGRTRPVANRGSQDYHPFNIGGSMPSFHTAEAFTAAAVISEHWDNPWVSALAYGAATGVGWSRIYEDRHWLSDVVLSAAIGTVVGKAVVALNRQRRDSAVSVVPLIAPGTWGAAVQVKY